MRLTLRTLLAYRDGVLSPSDSEDLHHRIQKSEGAGNLFRRIDSVARQPRILAPATIGTGLGADPNSVAEYLDDVLPSPQIPEFERVCLVSDVQLAELAQCHEFLASALTTKVDVPQSAHDIAKRIGKSSERAEIQNEIRQRWITNTTRSGAQTQVRADASHGGIAQPRTATKQSAEQNVAVKVQAPMVASGGDSIKPAGLDLENSTLPHEVPEYLVGANRRNFSVPVAIGALVALLGILVWQALGPLENVADLFKAKPAAARSGDAPQPARPAGSENKLTEEQQPSAEQPTSTSDRESPGPSRSTVGEVSTPSRANDQASESAAQPTASGEAPQTAAPTADATTSPATNNGNSPAMWRPGNGALPPAVLLKSTAGSLQRMRAGEAINPEETLLVPPASRTNIQLQPGVLWKTCGPSLMQIAAVDPAQPTRVTTRLCRAVVQGGIAGSFLLSTPVGNHTIQWTTPATHVSIEVAYRPTALGSVLDRLAVQPTLVVIVAEGSASILAAGPDAKATPLNIGEGLIVVGDARPRVFKLQAIPPWLSDNAQRPVDQVAAEDMSKLLANDAAGPTIPQQLMNLTTSRRPETAALAIQTLMLAGNWQPLAGGFLRNERFRAHWSDTLDLARQLLAMDPSASEQLSGGLAAVYGAARAESLLRLIVGLSEDEIAAVGIAPLVEQLDSNQLEDRVLAAYELRKLTGESFGYQPFAPTSTSLQTWRRELKRLQIVEPGDPAWERLPAG